MKKPVIAAICSLSIAACNTQQNEEMNRLAYPETRSDSSVVDNYFGTPVADPYRWLENDTSLETAKWVKAQNAVTENFLNKIPYRKALAKRFEELYNYPKLSSPRKVGDYYFFYKNDGLQNQAVIYYQKGLDGNPEVFIDPNAISSAGTVSIGLSGASDDDRYIAYTRQEAGSDWAKIYIREIATNTDLPDVIDWVKFSGASWYGDGFYYSRYPVSNEKTKYSAANENHSVYYHKMGTNPASDALIYSDTEHPKMYHYGGTTEDDEYLIIYKQQGTEGNQLMYKKPGEKGAFRVLVEGYKHKSGVVNFIDGKFLVRTNFGAPNYRLVAIDPEEPSPEKWREIIPESEHLLQGVTTGGGRLFATYLISATSRIYEMDYDGSQRREIALPTPGSAGGFGGKKEDDVLFYSFTSFTYPSSIFKYEVKTGISEIFYKPELAFNPEDYEAHQEYFKSKDGTKIPVFIVHKKGLQRTGKNPTVLYGYGGFNISLTPYFSPSNIILYENGGVYAMVNLRGGGEFGEDWHKAGMLFKKQNVFDDFIAAAEYLIAEGYTGREYLAIEGGSNGGLLVGACMTQRPELFSVALPHVGVMDMLRYHRFTVGFGWVPEYGSSEDSKEMFDYLYAYSPLHNLRPASYPATMVFTADHDDRVVPAHSFKFAAALQRAHQGNTPTLIRIETEAGHGAGKPTSKIIEEQADKWAFVFWNMGIKEMYGSPATKNE
jgi:prolyl oligopeptidase